MKTFKDIFHMQDETYDKLQWLFRIVFPKLLVLIGIVGQVVGWEYTASILTILGAIFAFVGESLGIASDNYKTNEQGLQ